MSKAIELLKRFVAAFDAYQQNYPTWKGKVDAERNAKKVRDDAYEYLTKKNNDNEIPD